MRRTKGPLSASIKSKRQEIKSDPTPFGYEGWCKGFDFPADTLRGAMAAGGKRQSMTSSNVGGAGSTAAVPRSTSQPGNCGGLMETSLRMSFKTDFQLFFWQITQKRNL
ncbi:hypothetical protein GOODEAATRI_011588 [Goodea atripinnis]|uniref:Uncharacterized protein n=1 Tax=Goodea atripinnis TaxID=208336 RepID=A0ABV0P4Y8_9TELE